MIPVTVRANDVANGQVVVARRADDDVGAAKWRVHDHCIATRLVGDEVGVVFDRSFDKGKYFHALVCP